MFRVRLAFLFWLSFVSVTSAQFTNVTGTVTDINGLAWAGGTITVTLSLPVGASGARLNGVQIGGTTQRTTLDGTGSFAMQLGDNNSIQTCTTAGVCTPGGTQWTFNVNISPGIPPPAGSGPQNCAATLTITGANQSVSGSFNACPALSKITSSGAFPPGGTPIQGQFNTGSGFGGSPCNNLLNLLTGPINFDCDAHFIGPNPYVDITRFGARSTNTGAAPQVPGVTATIGAGSFNATLSTASTFQNGDYVVVFNAGAAHTLTTPTAPTVTPSAANAGTGTGIVGNSAAGSTAYAYCISARTALEGITPCSPNGTTATGQATLGAQTVNISTLSRTNRTVTVTTSAPHAMGVGNEFFIVSTTNDSSFSTFAQVLTVPDNLHFTFTMQADTRASNSIPTSATGGTVTYYLCNNLTWTAVPNALSYGIFGRTAGSLALLYQQMPGLTSWCDPGATMNTGAPTPYFWPSTPPVAATPNSLLTKINNGAGTTTLTLRDSATTSATNQTILRDDGQAILAASASGNGVYIPVGSFAINSYTLLPNTSALQQQGTLTMNDSLDLNQFSQYYGNAFAFPFGVAQFANQNGAPVVQGVANPAVIGPRQGGYVKGLAINSGITNGVAWYTASGSNISFDDTNFVAGAGNSDAMGMALWCTDCSPFKMRHDTILGGGTLNTTITPGVFCGRGTLGCGDTYIDSVYCGIRCMQIDSPDVRVNWTRMQGGIEPVLTMSNGGNTLSLVFDNTELDTTVTPSVLLISSGGGLATMLLSANGGQPQTSSTGNGNPPTIQGPFAASVLGPAWGTQTYQRRNTGMGVPGQFHAHPSWGNSLQDFVESENFFSTDLEIGSGYGAFVGYTTLPVPIATVTTTCPNGLVTAGSHTYGVSALGLDGGETISGPQSAAVTTNGTTQCVNLTWTDPAGVAGYNVFRDGLWIFGAPTGTSCFSQGGISNSLKANSCTDGNQPSDSTPGTLNSTGNPSIYPGQITTTKLVMGSSAPAGTKYGGATLTGNFANTDAITVPDASGTMTLTQTGTALQLFTTPNNLIAGGGSVNAATTNLQSFPVACSSAPCIPAGSLNTVGKTFEIEAEGNVSFASTSVQFALVPGLGSVSGATSQPFFGAPSNAGTGSWWIKGTCVVTSTGSNGGFSCAYMMTFADAAGVSQVRNATIVYATGQNLTVATSPVIGIAFSTASTSNVGAELFASGRQQN